MSFNESVSQYNATERALTYTPCLTHRKIQSTSREIAKLAKVRHQLARMIVYIIG